MSGSSDDGLQGVQIGLSARPDAVVVAGGAVERIAEGLGLGPDERAAVRRAAVDALSCCVPGEQDLELHVDVVPGELRIELRGTPADGRSWAEACPPTVAVDVDRVDVLPAGLLLIKRI